jgi:hypothetical protein
MRAAVRDAANLVELGSLSPAQSVRATSAPGLGPPLPHLHGDWAHRGHVCTGTGPIRATSAEGLEVFEHGGGRGPASEAVCSTSRSSSRRATYSVAGRNYKFEENSCSCRPGRAHVWLARGHGGTSSYISLPAPPRPSPSLPSHAHCSAACASSTPLTRSIDAGQRQPQRSHPRLQARACASATGPCEPPRGMA